MSPPLPDYPQALATVLACVRPIQRTCLRPLGETLGCTMAQPVMADRDLPPFNRSTMDGYAMRAADVAPGRVMPVIGQVPAGVRWDGDIPAGCCVGIATGAPVPEQLDCVIQHEWTDRNSPVTINAPQDVLPGHAIHPRGADAVQGTVLIPSGTQLGPHHLGIAASVGAGNVICITPPRTTVLTSGDEVRPFMDATIEPHQIRNSNAIMLCSVLHRMGADVIAHLHLPDERDATITAVGDALATSDLVITVGGISAGKRDFFHDAYDALEIDRTLGGAAIQPGKPITMGRCDNHDANSAWMVSLPGNPVSSLACSCLFIWPMLERMLGRGGELPWRTVTLADPVTPNARRQAFRPATLCAYDHTKVRVPNWAGSGDLAHTARTDGLAELPIQQQAVAPGTSLRFLAWP